MATPASESTPILASQPQMGTAQVSGLLGQAINVLQTALPEYDFHWSIDASNRAACASLERGNVCILCLFGAFTQCCCMYAAWTVYVVVEDNKIIIKLGKAQDTLLVACCLGGLIGAALTENEYNRVRSVCHTSMAAFAQTHSSAHLTDLSPPSYSQATAGPPPVYSEVVASAAMNPHGASPKEGAAPSYASAVSHNATKTD